MKAVRLHAYGDASALRYEDAPMPELEDGDLLIRVVATSVNPVDWKIRQGHARETLNYPLPMILGWDVSGVVVSAGPKVTRFRQGDAVYARPDIRRHGTYAEYVAVRETEAAAKPATISHVEAATLPLVSITAWEALFTKGRLTAGQKVLIHAGAGGVGSIAIQLARAAGAEVTATGSPANADLIRGLGASAVIDYRKTPFNLWPTGFDVVLDTIGGETQEASWSFVKPGGTLVSIISPPSDARAKMLGVTAAYLFIDPNATVLEKVAALVDRAEIRPVIGAEFALRDIAKAHALSQSGHARGKIALYVGQP